MISEKRKLELQAERHLIQILYAARDNSEGHFKTIIQIEPLTKEEIQNVIDHYL
tara:strand:+ start:174 stop:335 length:162 start_codon:yes stop_codon:yes gene_type:complete